MTSKSLWSLFRRPLVAFVMIMLVIGAGLRPAEKVNDLRLYALDCGRAQFGDLAMFSDTGEYDGRSGTLAVPCFLIRHPKGDLLWDAGIGDEYLAEKKADANGSGIHLTLQATLAQQLSTLGMTPADISYLAFSHLHFDHTGNANLFSSAIWILNQKELDWALGNPTPEGVNPSSFSSFRAVKDKKMIDGDYDVFGDGSVRILRTPGHTPGHQVLEIKLKNTGTVILSGDLYHLRESYVRHRVPGFNYNRADTLASMDRIDRIITNAKARLVVQHDLADFNALPKFPEYLN